MLKYLLVFTYKKFQFLRDINQKILEALALRQAQFLFLLSIYIATKYKKKKKKKAKNIHIGNIGINVHAYQCEKQNIACDIRKTNIEIYK